ncbi:MAG: hypothetical protein ACP5ER_05230 [Candidatus Bathyarchaeales archaeon]
MEQQALKPMLTLNGQVINTFTTPTGKNKDGESYGGDHRIQIMCENTLRNGEKRNDLIDLTIKNESANYKTGQEVSIPVGVYVTKGEAKFYAL